MLLYKDMLPAAEGIAVDEMLLTVGTPTTAGSRMLADYRSLFEAEAITRLRAAGIPIVGKTAVGEFGIDLLGETCYTGACVRDGVLALPAAEAIRADEVSATLVLDTNGAATRGAASDLVYIKPTYGVVSRFGAVPAACSADTVGVMAATAAECTRVLTAIVGHDDKDGTSLSDEECRSALDVRPVRRVAVVTDLLEGLTPEAAKTVADARAALAAAGCEVTEVAAPMLAMAKEAYTILMSAEVCNNVSRYDGVKFGYRAEGFSGIDELYTKSRTEAFGAFLKTVILYGSDTLSTENYFKVYDKALRIRRKVTEAFATIFEGFDAVLLPTASRTSFTEADVAADRMLAFEEARYTAPALISGLPSVAVRGVALVGPAFADGSLLSLAGML